jgi:ATP-binding protein involved in chromosome partitioning
VAGDPRVEPAQIGPTEDGTRLRIEWADGVVSQYEPRELRLLCPCAACVDEMTGVRTLDPRTIDEGVYPTAIHYVGRYALQFMWSDGHSTGIYTFEYLRALSDERHAAE